MCQSQAEGGRRCAGRESVYPASAVDASLLSEGEVTVPTNSHEALHLIAYAAEGKEIPETVIEQTRAQGFNIASLSPKQQWVTWKSVTMSESPSEGLRMLHRLGYEEAYPELHAIRGVPQDSQWHPEGSVEKHTQEAADVSARRSREDRASQVRTQIAVLGALCHDFGKATHTQIDPETGAITSRGHDTSGVAKARSFLHRIGAPERVKNAVPVLVGNHMVHSQKLTHRGVRKLKKRLEKGGATLGDLIRVVDGDVGGRGSASQGSVKKEWRRVEREARISKRNTSFIRGAVFVELGHRPGPQFYDMMKAARAAFERDEFADENGFRDWTRRNYPIRTT